MTTPVHNHTHRLRNRVASLLLIAACTSAALWLAGRTGPRQSSPLPHEVYVWQRAWTPPVVESVASHATNFNSLVALGAEVTWKDGRPAVVRVELDYPVLDQTHTPISLALRIGPYGGPFQTNDPTTHFLAELAQAMIAEARNNGVEPVELQLDFDCAESKLGGYRLWLRAIQQRVAPVPVTITALPSWLGAPGFRALANDSTNYVLQVHSLDRPHDISQPFKLCDPGAAQRAVERAARFKVPFRVALPTYGYLLAFDPAGKFLGLSAEAAAPAWPAQSQVREVLANPLEMQELVRLWQTNRPAALHGVIWYRLPVSTDNLNWRWPTLGAIVASKALRESVRAESRQTEAGLMEIHLINVGSLDVTSPPAVTVRWTREGGARLVASDGLNGFEIQDVDAQCIQLRTRDPHLRLTSGETRLAGWLRFDRDCEVQFELK